MKSILVLRGGALGDFLITLPLLRALRTHWPQARIELAGNAPAAELARLAGIIDATHSQAEARWARLYSEASLSTEFRAWLERFDAIISFWPDADGDLATHFPLRPDQLFVQRDARVTTRPAAAHFLSALPSLGVSASELTSPALVMPPAIQRKADERLSFHRGRLSQNTTRKPGDDEASPAIGPSPFEFIAIHPGSGSPTKNWPSDRWRELVLRLDPCPVLVVLGEAERSLAATFATLDPERIQIADQWPLPLLAAALARCATYIGHDTGVSHLAAAVGARCLLLFGPTDPDIWAPPGKNARVLRQGARLEDISVDQVVNALT